MWSHVILASLLILSEFQSGSAMLTRGRTHLRSAAQMANMGCGSHGCDRVGTNKAEPTFEVLEETHFEKKKSADCLCPLGKFWHWRIKQCINQGPWGYECGFFPKEHHHRVCMDNLKCEPLKQNSTYQNFEGAQPATCVPCKPEDGCKVGEERHKADCLVEFTLAGEACSKVKVTQSFASTSSASAKHTAEETVKKQVTAEDTEDYEYTATAKASAKEDASVTKEATVTKEESAKATESATAEADGEKNGIKVNDVEAKESASAEGTAKATESAEATKSASAEATATAEATKTETATAEASGEDEATVKATRAAEVKVTADADGVGEAKRCLALDEVKKLLDMGNLDKFGAVISAQIIAEGDKVAFDRAYKAALESAEKAGIINAKEAAVALAKKKAEKDAKMAAVARAKEKAAWKAEAGATDIAEDKANNKAYEEAKAKAKYSAEEAAKAKAEEEASAKASAAAGDAAGKKADAAAADAAGDKASASAEAAASDEASAKAEAKAEGKAEDAAGAKADANAAEASGNVADASHPPDQVDPKKRPKADEEDKTAPKHMTDGDVAASLP